MSKPFSFVSGDLSGDDYRAFGGHPNRVEVPPEGKKYDHGKPRFSLIPHTGLTQLMAVLEYGASKYGAHNWRLVSDGKTRYADAAMRHFLAWQAGETLDAESGLPHLAHALASLMFLCELDD